MNSQLSAGCPGLRDVEQAAEYLKLSGKQVRREVYAGRLSHVRIGRRLLFTEADLTEFVERCRVSA